MVGDLNIDRRIVVILALWVGLFSDINPAIAGKLVKDIPGEGSCAVVGITPEQGRLIALRRARADAIEKACGIKILGSTLVRNGRLVGEFLKTFTRGFIIKEHVKWLPLGELRAKNGNEPPIPLYRVKLRADVLIPERVSDQGFSLSVRLNTNIFKSGEQAELYVSVTSQAKIAIFNIRADDRVVMLYPLDKDLIIRPGQEFIFPEKGSGMVLKIQTFKGHKQDSEAFMVAALSLATMHKFNMHNFSFSHYFRPNIPYRVPEFLSRYSNIADYTIEKIIPYEVYKSTSGTSLIQETTPSAE